MKSIVVFSDGTGNSAASPHKTNVWRLYKSLKIGAGSNQVSYYDDGVGTSSFRITEILGLVFGLGLASNVKSIYRFVCRSYEQGDKIYGFGFSRGAFTMRVVMSLISEEGLVKTEGLDEREFENRINRAYISYRKKSFNPSIFSFVPVIVHSLWKNKPLTEDDVCRPTIEMLGVWDTVDAYGMPIDELRRAWDMVIYPLTARDRNCAVKVQHAYHALALDEQRLSFAPILWNEGDQSDQQSDSATKLTQVWFPGVHADIGGGYPNESLALIPLLWMIKKAQKHGIEIDDTQLTAYQHSADVNGPMHDSRAGVGFVYRFEPRHVEALCRDSVSSILQTFQRRLVDFFTKRPVEDNEVYIELPKVHKSVHNRLAEYANNYAPVNMPENYVLVDDDNNVVEKIESSTQTERRDDQGKLWNIVAARKLIYVINVLILLWIASTLSKDSGLPGFLKTISVKDAGWIKVAFEYLNINPGSALMIGAAVGFLFLGAKYKQLLHSEMKKIWQKAKGASRGVNPSGTVSIISKAIYDDRIKSNQLISSSVSKCIRIFRFIVELLCVLLLFCAPFILFKNKLFVLGLGLTIPVLAMFSIPLVIMWGICRYLKL